MARALETDWRMHRVGAQISQSRLLPGMDDRKPRFCHPTQDTPSPLIRAVSLLAPSVILAIIMEHPQAHRPDFWLEIPAKGEHFL